MDDRYFDAGDAAKGRDGTGRDQSLRGTAIQSSMIYYIANRDKRQREPFEEMAWRSQNHRSINFYGKTLSTATVTLEKERTLRSECPALTGAIRIDRTGRKQLI